MKITQLLEASPYKTAVISWGRMNPPTIGHQRVIDVVKGTAQKVQGDPIIFVTKTQDAKKNPLSFAEKVHFIQELFPGVTVNQNSSVKTIIQALQLLQGQGYKNVAIVAGSDRVDQYQSLVDKYNNTPDKSGEIPFAFKNVKVVSSGERDPDADDITGMSASKMRNFAVNNDFDSFAQGVAGNNEVLAKQMFQRVRKGMGLEDVQERKLTKKEIKKRDKYADDLPDKEFKKRYGKDWEAVKYGTATNMAKNKDVNEGSLRVPMSNFRSFVASMVNDLDPGDFKTIAKVARTLGKEVFVKNDKVVIQDPDFDYYKDESVEEEAAGVGTITKQNTTSDVKKGTLKKMLKGYKLI